MTIINIASKKSIYIIPGSKSYTLMPEIYTPVDMDMLDSAGLYSVQRDLDVLIVSDNNTALRQYLSKKTLQGAVSAESIQDLMAATLTNSVYDDEANTILVGGSGGNRYVGEWDLNFGGYATLVEAFPDPTKSTGFSTISNNIFQYLGDNAPANYSSLFYDYVVAEGASSIDSGIRSMKVNIPSTLETNCNIFYGIVNNTNTVDDLMRVINGDIGLTVSGILFYVGVDSIKGFLVYCYVINNGVLDAENLWGTRILSPVADEPIYIDLNTATGSFSISITGEPNRIEQLNPETFNEFLPSTGNTFISPSILDLSNFTTDTFAPFFAYSFYLIGQSVPISPLTFDLGTEDDGRLPFLSPLQVIEPPVDATDGQVYKVVGNGTYLDNPPLADNDYVEFTENLQNLIITRPSKTDAQLNNSVLEKIDEQVQPSGIIDTAIKDSIAIVEQILPINDGGVVYISTTATFVELTGNVGSFAIVNLPSAANQQIGKHIIVMSSTTGGSSVSIHTNGSTLQGLPAVTDAVAGTVFEFVLRRYSTNTPIWVRVK